MPLLFHPLSKVIKAGQIQENHFSWLASKTLRGYLHTDSDSIKIVVIAY